MKEFFLVVIVLLFTALAQAESFSPAQIERIKVFKQRLGDVDKKTLNKTIAELQKAQDPQLALELQEVMAQVYTEIVTEKDVHKPADREWLYAMVTLNMANLQFNGRSTYPLSGLIVKKLKEHLSPNVLSNPHFHVSVE